MAHWLVKTEPETFSFADLVRDGRTKWDGVRNYLARNHLRAMREGDVVLVYHSVSDKAVVGIARVSGPPAPDTSAPEGDWTYVPMVPERPLTTPVSLAVLKADPALAGLALLKQARLSVMPVTPAEYVRILELGGTPADAPAAGSKKRRG